MKGVAVYTIVLLAIGIVVLAIVAYLVYSQFLGGGKTFDESKCQSDILSDCTKCKVCYLSRPSPCGTWSVSATCAACSDVCPTTADSICPGSPIINALNCINRGVT